MSERPGAAALNTTRTATRILDELGPAYVKLGQFLALHPDLSGPVLHHELLELVDRAPPLAWEQVRAILIDDLGRDLGECFDTIAPAPLSSGLLAQTHRAVLPDGARVTVKVQRPQIRAEVATRIGQGRGLARKLERAGIELAIAPRELVERFDEWLARRLDAERELENMTELHRQALDSDAVAIPQPYPDLSSARVITAADLGGVPFAQLLPAGPAAVAAPGLAGRLGLDRELLADQLVVAVLTQIFRYHLFQADVLPENVLALPRDAIGFADFSYCERTGEMWRDRDLRLAVALYDGDVHGTYGVLAQLVEQPDELDQARFREELVIVARGWRERESHNDDGRRAADAGGTAATIADQLLSVLRLCARHNLRLRPGELGLLRTLATAETIAVALAGDGDPRSVGYEFLFALRRRAALRRFERQDLTALGVDLIALLRESPRHLQQTLRELGEGTFELPVNAAELPGSHAARRRRVRVLAAAALSVGVAALLATPRVRGLGLAVPLLALLTCIYATVAVGWWRLR